MDRRNFLKASSIGVVGGLSGCLSSIGGTFGDREVEWEYSWEGAIGAEFSPRIYIWGSIHNVGDLDVDRVRLSAHLLDQNEQTIAERSKWIRNLGEGEAQDFYFRFTPSEEVEQIEDVKVESNFED